MKIEPFLRVVQETWPRYLPFLTIERKIKGGSAVKGGVWSVQTSEFTVYVYLQKSKTYESRVTVNVTLTQEGNLVEAVQFDVPEPLTVGSYRLGLFGEGNDLWWVLEDEEARLIANDLRFGTNLASLVSRTKKGLWFPTSYESESQVLEEAAIDMAIRLQSQVFPRLEGVGLGETKETV